MGNQARSPESNPLRLKAERFASEGVEIDARDGTSTGEGDDTVAGFEHVLGTEHADTIHGDHGPNTSSAERVPIDHSPTTAATS